MTQRPTLQNDTGKLEGDEARLRWMSKVFMDAADPILIEDLEGSVIDMNAEAERAYDWPRDELLGRPIREIVPEQRHSQANELLVRCRDGEEVRNIEGLRQNRQADDEPETRGLLQRILEKDGLDVVEATNGADALERVRERLPDLIILDLMMPVMNGFEFIAELRAVESWHDVPVIVSTGKDLTSEERLSLSGVVEGILQKSASSMAEVMSQVHRVLIDHAGRDEA